MTRAAIAIFVTFSIGCFVSAEIVTVDNVKYYISDIKANWFEAGRICKSEYGMVLVDIVTEQENTRIMNLIKPFMGNADARFWTSGTDLGSEGTFYWASSGHSVLFNNFHPTQPDNWENAEHCVVITKDYGFKWNDEKCNEQIYFICRNSVSYPLNNCICLNA